MMHATLLVTVFAARVFAAEEVDVLAPEKWQYAATTGCKGGFGGAVGTRCGTNEWSTIFATCGEVGTQSPIDVVPANAGPSTTSTFLVDKFHYQACNHAEFVLNPHTVQVNMPASYGPNDCTDMGVQFNGKRFNLKQWHYHSPSEHTVDGKYYPMEAHYVHKAADGQLLVVSVMIALGEASSANTFLGEVLDRTPPKNERYEMLTANDNTHTMTKDWATMDPYSFAPSDFSTSHFEYVGSLTTPPCTHGEQWIISGASVTITQETLDRYRTIINGNGNNQLGLEGKIMGDDKNTPKFNDYGWSGDLTAWNGDLGCNNRPIQAFGGKDGDAVPRNFIAKGSPSLGKSSGGGNSYTVILIGVAVLTCGGVGFLKWKKGKQEANGKELRTVLLA